MTVCLSHAPYPGDTAGGHHGNRVLGGNCNHVPGRQLFAARIPDKQRFAVSPPTVCAVLVYLRTGPNEYQVYRLEGGP